MVVKYTIKKVVFNGDEDEEMDLSDFNEYCTDNDITPTWTHVLSWEYDDDRRAYCFTDEDKMVTWLKQEPWDDNDDKFLFDTYHRLREICESFKSLNKPAKKTFIHLEKLLVSCKTQSKINLIKELDLKVTDTGFFQTIFEDKPLLNSSNIYSGQFYNQANSPPEVQLTTSNTAYIEDGLWFNNLASLPRGAGNWDKQIQSVQIGTPGVLRLCLDRNFVPPDLYLWGPGEFPVLDFGNPIGFGKSRSLQSLQQI